MGRKRIHPKIEPNAKPSKAKPAPAEAPQPGTYAFKATFTDHLGMWRDLEGVVDAESRAEAYRKVDEKTPQGWKMARVVVTFLGCFAGLAFIGWLLTAIA